MLGNRKNKKLKTRKDSINFFILRTFHQKSFQASQPSSLIASQPPSFQASSILKGYNYA